MPIFASYYKKFWYHSQIFKAFLEGFYILGLPNTYLGISVVLNPLMIRGELTNIISDLLSITEW
jgi:hypothetical protein